MPDYFITFLWILAIVMTSVTSFTGFTWFCIAVNSWWTNKAEVKRLQDNHKLRLLANELNIDYDNSTRLLGSGAITAEPVFEERVGYRGDYE